MPVKSRIVNKAPCYQHDSYDRYCSSCRELNEAFTNTESAEQGLEAVSTDNGKEGRATMYVPRRKSK